MARLLAGTHDGVAKTPEWQEAGNRHARPCRARVCPRSGEEEDLSAARAVRMPASAVRAAAQPARSGPASMILMMAMQGWGKPGVNLGNLQGSTPLDFSFYFPGYAEGGISGDLQWTASAINNYERMPHVLTMNPGQADDSAPALPGRHHRRKMRRLRVGRLVAGSTIRAVRVSAARPIRGCTCSIAMAARRSEPSPTRAASSRRIGIRRSNSSSTSLSGSKARRSSPTSSCRPARQFERW